MSSAAALVSVLVVMSSAAALVCVLVVVSSAAALVSVLVVVSSAAALVSVLVVMSATVMMPAAAAGDDPAGGIYEQVGAAEGLHAVFLAKGVLGLPRQLRHGDQKYFSVEVQWFHRFSEMVFMGAKIVKAESKAARRNEVFPRGFFRMASCFGRSRRETGNFFSGSSGGGLPAGSTGDFPEKIFRRRFWGMAGFD